MQVNVDPHECVVGFCLGKSVVEVRPSFSFIKTAEMVKDTDKIQTKNQM